MTTHNIMTLTSSDIGWGILAILGGMGLSFCMVSYLMRDHGEKDPKYTYIFTPTEEMIKSNKQRQKCVSYGNNFYDELEALQDRELSDEELTNLFDSIVEEETPEGKVIMRYNTKVERYEYFSDNKNISNRILDAVCRKYAITYDCKEICLNHRKEIERVREKLQKSLDNTDENTDKKEDNTTDSVFIKPKTKSNATTTTKTKTKRKVVLEKMNYFTRKGNMLDYKDYIDSKEEPKKPVLSFADYKKMQDAQKNKTQ